MFKCLLATASLAALAFVPALHAGSYNNDKTTVRFDEPVLIDGKTIPAGTYQFMAFPDNREVVVVKNRDETRVVGIFNTREVRARNMPQKTSVWLTAGTKTEPPSVVEWFYPGERLAWKFAVSK